MDFEKMDVEKKVIEVIMGEVKDEVKGKVSMDARFVEDLELDSLGVTELLMAFGEAFDAMDIPEEDEEKIVTVRDAVVYFQEYVASLEG